MNPPDLVQELGQRLKLTGLTLNDGVCRLVFDAHLPIDIEDDGAGNLVLHTLLGPLPHIHRESVLLQLLSAHLFGVDTDGAAFGLHPKTQDVYLFRTLPVSTLEVDTMMDALERFTQQAENWKQQLTDMVRDTARVSAPTPSPSELIRA